MANPSTFQIGAHRIGQGAPCFVIAEVGQAHDGSLGAAHAYIDAIATTGADAVKFQTHIAAAESTPREPWRVKFSTQDDTRYDYWRRMQFTEIQWAALKQHAEDRGLIFLSSPFSCEAVDLLQRLDIAAWKIASGEILNPLLLNAVAQTAKPAILSCGMVGYDDLNHAVQILTSQQTPLAILQCTTAYPCPPEKTGLNVIDELRDRYAVPVGLSDHSGEIFPALAAVARGANIIEVHLTLSAHDFGPDVPASLTPAQLTQLVDGIRFTETMLAHPVDKNAAAQDLASMRTIFGKSVVAQSDLPAGHTLTLADLTVKKPGDGIPASRVYELVGRQLNQAVIADELIREQDLAPQTRKET